MLAAGAGERLRPLTWVRPKVLCPVAGVPLLDDNIERVAAALGDGSVAVNVHHHREQLEAHLAARHRGVHVSVEEERPLGTAGAIGRLRDWLDGRPVLVVNGDSWTTMPVTPLLQGWDGDRVRVLVPGGAVALAGTTPVAGTLLPAAVAAALRPEPSGSTPRSGPPRRVPGGSSWWRAPGRSSTAARPRPTSPPTWWRRVAIRSSTPPRRWNTAPGSCRSVVWPGAVVGRSEVLVDAIRTGAGVTVLVRSAFAA